MKSEGCFLRNSRRCKQTGQHSFDTESALMFGQAIKIEYWGGVEEVCRLVFICGVRWWEARMQRSAGGEGFDPQKMDTERMCFVSPGHQNCIAGSVEGVHRLVLICRLRWWEARMQRSTGGKGFDPQKTDTKCMRSVSPGHRNCISGGVEGVRRLVLICKLRWWEARMQRSRKGGGLALPNQNLSVMRLLSPVNRKRMAGGVEGACAMGSVC